MQKDVRVTVIGKVFRPNRLKILALNRALYKYFRLIKWYLGFNSTSKTFLHKNGYKRAKRLFNLNPALIQTARDKAVEMLKSFKESRKEDSLLKPQRISIRFDNRCYRFSKTTNVLTPYWLTLSLNRRETISLPIIFGEKQKQRIEEALRGEWKFATVEMVKQNGEWCAHFVLSKTVELPNDQETIVAIDRGEHNLAVAVAISKNNPNKPMRGQFWRGEEIKRIKGLYNHIRRNLQKKHRVGKVKDLKDRESQKVNQRLHIIANQIIAYVQQFPKPVIVMENLTGIRNNFNRSAGINRRLHSLPFRKLQDMIEYKALLSGIEVKYLPKSEVRNTTKECHRCGHVAQVRGRIYKCPNCGMEYDRDLNACINIAHRVMSSVGWGSGEPPEPADVSGSVKLQANAGSSTLAAEQLT